MDELPSGRVQREEDPDADPDDQGRDQDLRIGGHHPADEQRRQGEGGLLHGRDLAVGSAQLDEHSSGEEDAEEGAVAELRHRTRHPLEGLEPTDDQRREAEEANAEQQHQDRCPCDEQDLPDPGGRTRGCRRRAHELGSMPLDGSREGGTMAKPKRKASNARARGMPAAS
jgi:hypothetical protein